MLLSSKNKVLGITVGELTGGRGTAAMILTMFIMLFVVTNLPEILPLAGCFAIFYLGACISIVVVDRVARMFGK